MPARSFEPPAHNCRGYDLGTDTVRALTSGLGTGQCRCFFFMLYSAPKTGVRLGATLKHVSQDSAVGTGTMSHSDRLLEIVLEPCIGSRISWAESWF